MQIVSQELGVSVATLERWRADALSTPARDRERVWTAAARLQAVIVTAAMDESQRSAWCRENGVYPSELEQWKQSAMAALNETPRSGPVRRKRETHANASRNSNEICDAGQSARRDDSIIGAVKTTAGDLPARRRGRMILVEDRQMIAARIAEAQRKGARLKVACELAGIDVRTLQRWKREGLEHGDRRPHAVRPVPTHALSAEERAHIVQIANEPRFAELPPARIVPMLADEGTYIASESSFNRVLRAHGQMRHRGRAKTPQRRRPPSTHIATAPRQLWCWDVTFLAGQVAGQWFYLYLILDVYSRKIVGFEVHETDSSDHAVDLLRRTALRCVSR